MSNQLERSKLERLRLEAEKAIQKGNIDLADDIAARVLALGPSPNVSYIASALLVDIGNIKNDSSAISKGIHLMKKDLGVIAKVPRYKPSLYYNLGNGYHGIFNLKSDEERKGILFRRSELDDAIKYYVKALECNFNDPLLRSRIYVNLGNCYDSLGRSMDALECYDKALVYKPNHGMAYINKARALIFFARYTRKQHFRFLIEAYQLLKEGLDYGVNQGVIPLCQKDIQYIEGRFRGREYLLAKKGSINWSVKGETKFAEFLIRYCLKNKLYLNICSFCQECSQAIGDPETIENVIISLKRTPGYLDHDQFMRLASYINQIKQDYITARFLLILSQYRRINIKFVDAKVRLIDTLDFQNHNIRLELLKSSFVSLFNILDKIGVFIHEYLGLSDGGGKKIDFSNVWYVENKDINPKFYLIKNFCLNALYHMHRDIEKGKQQKIRNIRNLLTHSYLNIYHSFGLPKKGSMTEDTFLEDTLELARLVRNAVIYLLKFVLIEEVRKKNPNEELVKMPIWEVPD